MKASRPAFALAAALTAALSSACAQQAAWPSRPLHIIAPLPAGSAADTLARLVAAKLSEDLGQPVIVDNRDGGSGVIGTTQVAHAEPDGYTLGLATTTTLVTAPILDKRIGYDATRDFTPIAMVGYSPYVFVVNPAMPARNVHDFIAVAKSRPGGITYSSVGEASLARLGAELFSSMAGIKLTQVPYKSSTQAVIDLLAGRIDSQFGILATTWQYIREGKLVSLGVSTLARAPGFESLPTISESGLPGFEASLWLGVIAPIGVDPAIAKRLNDIINRALNAPDTRRILFDQAIIVDTGAPERLRQRIEADAKTWRALAARASL